MFPARLYPDFPPCYLSRRAVTSGVDPSGTGKPGRAVDGDPDGERSVAATVAALGSQPITIVSPVSGSNPPSLVLCRGDDYNATTVQQVVFSIPLTPVLAGHASTVMLYLRAAGTERVQSTRYSTLLSQALDLENGLTTTATAQVLTFPLTHKQTAICQSTHPARGPSTKSLPHSQTAA